MTNATAWFRRTLLVVGLAAAAFTLSRLDMRSVGESIERVGWRLLLLLVLEIIPELLYATGWRFAFTPSASKSYSLGELLRLWVTGEGVNYLVPTASVAGEVARVAMLNDSHPADVRAASVVIARISGTVGQVVFLLTGFALVLPSLAVMREHSWIAMTAAVLLAVLTIALIVYLTFGWRWIKVSAEPPVEPKSARWLRAMPGHLRAYFGVHPIRFFASVISFAAAYAFGAVEAFLICRFIGIPVSAQIALSIEVLSVTIDGVLFLVPAKAGTQELGKTAIFSLLGLPAGAGFAFGVVRHIRELAWALAGFGMYTFSGRERTA